MKALAILGMCMVTAFPALAGDKAPLRPRLVTGNVEVIRPMTESRAAESRATESRASLFAIGGFSLGTLIGAPPVDAAPEAMAFGGYATYTLDALRFSSSLKGDAAASAADFTASYPMGLDGMAAVTLGYEWSRHASFSVNPMLGNETLRPAGDLSLSLSFSHSVTPAVTFGGFAAATRTEEDQAATSGFRLGAGMGLKF